MKPEPIVYLCGPINGCADAECKDWRTYAAANLARTLDPMVRDYRGREMESGIATEIVENDKCDIDSSDVLLVNWTGPSVGTSMEILYAWERQKTVIVVMEANSRPSPWLVYHSTTIVHSMSDAIAILTG
jgi:nucleoside 2-deoxyribosyltransferase